ncbi:MAG TPA: DNA methyltransferase, partial [Polyangiaceae bacterium]|nr:DNA methyltransferase [Polyangiaceae bacterium]
ILGAALDVPSSTDDEGEAQARDHVHGFHAYPARMHPVTARRFVEALTTPGATVLDPFCGSGTVVVEAALLGRRALGSDLNPLAVRLARLKVTPASPAYRRALLESATQAAEIATERRKTRAGASRRYPRADATTFDPHVLLELDGIRVGIEAEESPRLRGDLLLVLSSILVKLSRRAADTALRERPTRIAAGYPTKVFIRRTEELARQLAEIEPRLSAAPPAHIEEDDARTLRAFDSGSVDLVLTSPPYAGVYDYLEHHAMRLRWLGLDERRFAEGEIGARRHIAGDRAPDAARLFREQTRDMLAAMARVLRSSGKAVLLVADGLVARRALRIDELLRALAPDVGLEVVAIASQARPHFHAPTAAAFADAPRREHAVMLVKRGRA